MIIMIWKGDIIMLKIIKKAISFIDETLFIISASGLALLTVVSVFFRFALNNPIGWSEEVQMILVVWGVFFGASMAIREEGHIAVDIIFDAFSVRLQRAWSVVIWCITFASIAIIGKLEIDRTVNLVRAGLCTPVLHIPSWVEYVGVVFACMLMLAGHLIQGIEAVRGIKECEAKV